MEQVRELRALLGWQQGFHTRADCCCHSSTSSIGLAGAPVLGLGKSSFWVLAFLQTHCGNFGNLFNFPEWDPKPGEVKESLSWSLNIL